MIKTAQDQLAFGVVPAYRRYELYQARYHELVPVVAEAMKRSTAPLRILDIGPGNGDAKKFVDALTADDATFAGCFRAFVALFNASAAAACATATC